VREGAGLRFGFLAPRRSKDRPDLAATKPHEEQDVESNALDFQDDEAKLTNTFGVEHCHFPLRFSAVSISLRVGRLPLSEPLRDF
jgi:hypothetical protein